MVGLCCDVERMPITRSFVRPLGNMPSFVWKTESTAEMSTVSEIPLQIN